MVTGRVRNCNSVPEWVFKVAQMVKNPPAIQETWVGKIPWRMAWQPTSVFFPGQSHGQRSLVGYSPRGHKKSDITERLITHSIKVKRGKF